MSAESIRTIRELIANGEYDPAITIIDSILSIHNSALITESSENIDPADLISLRVTAMTLLGRKDETILDYVRRDKIASTQNYIVDKIHTISLREKNLFLSEANAYINTIHVEKLFDLPQRSASFEFKSRIDNTDLQRQLSTYCNVQLGDVIELQHENLMAPTSFHIVCYEGEMSVNLDALYKGLRTVLLEISKRQMEIVASVPLGYSFRTLWTDDEQKNWNPQIADKIAECIVTYLLEKPRNSFPKIQFCFMSINSILHFDRAFYHWTGYGKEQIRFREKLGERQKHMIENVRTQDIQYQDILRKIAYAVDEDSKILLLGETGVGKSYLAELIHRHSSRSGQPFKSINMAYVRPDHLFTHIFGWRKGSFTGAVEHGAGLIELAQNGTFFLDEIGYADIEVQRGLLTLLDKGSYYRNGEPQIERQSNARMIFGTNQNLEELIKKGTFTEDLYERISGRVFEIPALRDRKDDISWHAKLKLDELSESMGISINIEEAALTRLKEYWWPGNIRQLRSYIQNQYHNCRSRNFTVITLNMILKDPPRDNSYKRENGIVELESILEKLLKTWDSKKGPFIDEFLSPIVAKIFLDDLKMKKEDASDIIGLDGSRGKISTLAKKYQRYFELRKI